MNFEAKWYFCEAFQEKLPVFGLKKEKINVVRQIFGSQTGLVRRKRTGSAWEREPTANAGLIDL